MTGRAPQPGELWDVHGTVLGPPGTHTELRLRILATQPNDAGGVDITDCEPIELSVCAGPPSPQGMTPADVREPR